MRETALLDGRHSEVFKLFRSEHCLSQNASQCSDGYFVMLGDNRSDYAFSIELHELPRLPRAGRSSNPAASSFRLMVR